MLISLVLLIVGFVLLALAADKLVAGSTQIAKHMGVPALTIGITIVALGTSLPEITSSIYATLYGNPQLALGNAIGSNIANLGLVLGLTMLLVPITIKAKVLFAELPLLFIVMLFVSLLMFDDVLGRVDGVILAFAFVALVWWLLRRAKLEGKDFDAELVTTLSLSMAWFWLIFGLILLPISSHLIVDSSVTIARAFNVSDLAIGLTLFALGTSLPELATCIAGARKRQYNLIIGNIIGSNIFNLVAVLCLPAMIKPIPVTSLVLWRDLPIMFVITIVFYIAIFFAGKKYHSKWTGSLFILLYLVYLALIISDELLR